MSTIQHGLKWQKQEGKAKRWQQDDDAEQLFDAGPHGAQALSTRDVDDAAIHAAAIQLWHVHHGADHQGQQLIRDAGDGTRDDVILAHCVLVKSRKI